MVTVRRLYLIIPLVFHDNLSGNSKNAIAQVETIVTKYLTK
ncbi:hypothetical protein [Trichocoleus sp. FACHB-69]|nr:hypothetical protein [Trichocoleus sp. FACHB-69]